MAAYSRSGPPAYVASCRVPQMPLTGKVSFSEFVIFLIPFPIPLPVLSRERVRVRAAATSDVVVLPSH